MERSSDAAFAEAVRTGTPAPVTGEDARAALAIALAAAESAESGNPVRVTA
jgi:myo-inositol 2-dehydrogenase/D-chiro-inositol 1-dehydrogenase